MRVLLGSLAIVYGLSVLWATAFPVPNENVSAVEAHTSKAVISSMATAWLCDCRYRREITIANTGPLLANYQVRVNVTYDADMSADFSDLRFTSSDEQTELSYWIETFQASTSAVVWVKVPAIAAGGNTAIFMYYNGCGTLTTGDPTQVFDFYDDFSNFTGWNSAGSGSVQQNTGIFGQPVLRKYNNCDPNGGWKSLGLTINDFRLITRERRNSATSSSGCQLNRYGLENASFNGYNINRDAHNTGNGAFGYERRTGGGGGNSNRISLPQPYNNWYRTELRRCCSTNTLQADLYSDNRTLIGGVAGTAPNNRNYCGFDRVTMRGGIDYYVDFVAVAKFTCNQPTVSVGTEENDPPMAMCQNISVNLDGTGNVTIVAADVNNGSTDLCGIANLVVSPSSFDCGDIGSNTVNLTVTDLEGNIASCNAMVTVSDNMAPTLSCPSNISVDNDAGSCHAVVTYAFPTATDNCGFATIFPDDFDPIDPSIWSSILNGTVDMGCGSASGNALHFSGNGARSATTIDFDVSLGGTVDFALIFGSGSTPCENADGGEDVVLEYSTNGGTSYTIINTYDTEAYTSFTAISEAIPAAAQTASTRLRWRQISHSGNGFDNWALDDLSISSFTPSITQTAGLPSGSTFPVGTTTNTFSVADASGNTSMCSFTVTVSDAENPTITCPGNITVNNDMGNCSAVVSYTAPVGTDNCSGAITTQTAGLASGASFPVGTTTNTFVVTDASGNTSSCSFTVTVSDAENPTITCPGNITVNNDMGNCSAVVSYMAPVGTDNCSGAITTQTAGLASGASFPVGTTTNTFVVTDASGNTSSCSFTVTVSDAENPTITCPGNITVNNDMGNCSAVVSYMAPVGTDNCSGAITTQTAGLASGASFPVGTTTNTFVVTDASGNTSSCSFTVTVSDAENPTITCPGNITVNNDMGNCSAVVSYTAPVGTDNCSGAITTQTAGLASGAAFPVGTTTNTFVVTDASGNTSSCSFTVTVSDAENPTITCPGNITVNNDMGNCSAVVSYTAPVGTDNCSGAITTQTAGLASGASFPVGTTTNTFVVTDASGNTSSCSFTVTVSDAENPTITCPGNITVNNDMGNCSAVVSYTAPVGTDNCSGAITTQTAGLASGAAFPVGTTTNTFVVTDASGNTSSCSFTVTVSDAENPTITCPGNITVNNDMGNCSAVVSYMAPVGTDNCSGAITTQTAGLASGASFPVGTTTNTFVVTDASGNTSSCSFTVTVSDAENPTITCPGNITVNNDMGNCSAVVSYMAPVGTDNCSGAITTQTAGLASGAAFPVGTTTNTFVVTDASGNTSSCSFTVTVSDAENPTITCPGNITVNNDMGNCSAVVSGELYGTGRHYDNCSGCSFTVTVMTTQTAGLASGAAFPVGTTTNTFVVTDASGNTSSCSFTVTVSDAENPTITCPGNITVNNDMGNCSAVVSYMAPVGTDNCSGAITTQTAGLASGAAFPVGTTTNTFVVTDASGNTSSCSFTVTVSDAENPTITCPGNITVNNDMGNCSAVVSYMAPVGTDNCSGAITTQTAGLASGASFPVGTTTNTFVVTDASGNTSSCSFTVTVSDAENPTITCPGNITVNNDMGNCSAVVSYMAPVGTDNCSGSMTTQTAGLASGASFPVGTTTNTFVVTDASGNTSSCSFTVTVSDAENPTITCPWNITVNNDMGSCSAVVSYMAPVGTDNCSGAITTQTAGLASGSAFPLGTTTNTFVVTDAAGNTATCSFDVTITDTESPTISCPMDVTQGNDAGLCTGVVTYTTPVGVDNCSGSMTTQTAGLASGSAFPLGTTTNTFVVTDAAGNTATCSFDVTITDTESPMISCPMDVTQGNDVGLCTGVVTYATPVGVDNCSGSMTTQTAGLASGSAFPLGTTTNTFVVTDAAGNTAMCSFDVTITDTESPTISCPMDVTQGNDAGLCTGVVTYTTPVGVDNCSGSMTTQTAGLASGSAFPLGTTTNTFVVTDAAGNTATCSFDVTITDTESPITICQNANTYLDSLGKAGIAVGDIDNGSTDNCSIISLEVSPSTFTCSDLGMRTVMLIAADPSGNRDTCMSNVSVLDTLPPQISMVDDIDLDAMMNCSGSLPDFVPIVVITDNCDPDPLVIQTPPAGTILPLDTTITVTITAEDQSGNIDSIHFDVNVVEGNPSPTLNCRDLNLSINTDGQVQFRLTEVVPGANCTELLNITIETFTGRSIVLHKTGLISSSIVSFDACSYVGRPLKASVTNIIGSSCWSTLTISASQSPIFATAGRSQVLYCDDPVVQAPQDDAPIAVVPCQGQVKVDHANDWVHRYACDPGIQDTAKVIIREWEAYGKDRVREVLFDTLVVLQFPEIDLHHIYCTEVDTVYCADTSRTIGPFVTFDSLNTGICDTSYLVKVTDRDQDGILEFVPTTLASKCGFSIHVDSWHFGSSCEHQYKVVVELKQHCYGAIQNSCRVDLPAGTLPNSAQQIAPGYWRCEFWLSDLDTLAPKAVTKVLGEYACHLADTLLSEENGFINEVPLIYTSDAACEAHTYIPALCVFDDWSGIKTVKATIPGLGTYLMENDGEVCFISKGDTAFAYSEEVYADLMGDERLEILDSGYCYRSHELISLPNSKEPIAIYYEVMDSCHLVGRDTGFVMVKDHTRPVAVADKGITVSLHRKKVWVDAEEFEEGSSDNCGIELTLARRADWKENCVDLCHNASEDGVESTSALKWLWTDGHDTLWTLDLEADEYRDDIEARYAKQMDWLISDGQDCGAVVYNSWQYDLMKYASTQCKPAWSGHYTDFEELFKRAIGGLQIGDQLRITNDLHKARLDTLPEDIRESLFVTDDVVVIDGQSLIAVDFFKCQPVPDHCTSLEDILQMNSSSRKILSCIPDLDILPLESLATEAQQLIIDDWSDLGGGWSDAVPLGCEDACGPVTVELLVMDYWCNWSKTWTEVWVEDKRPIEVARDVAGETFISCKVFIEDRYDYPGEDHPKSIAYLVDRGKEGDSVALARLDAIFGGYQKVWLDPYNRYVNIHGHDIETDISFYDSTCMCSSYLERVRVYDDHNQGQWKDSLVKHCYYQADTLTLHGGLLTVNCDQHVYCEQELWSDLDLCGQGYLFRQWKIWQGCSAYSTDSLTHIPDTLYRHQRIWIGNHCPLDKAMFEIPRDKAIHACKVDFDPASNGQVVGIAEPEHTGYPVYVFDDDCRQPAVAHRDKVFKIVGGDQACYKILRTWYFADWCQGVEQNENWWHHEEEIGDTCVQKIIVFDTLPPRCLLTGPVEHGDTIWSNACAYDLKVTLEGEDACDVKRYDYELVQILEGDQTDIVKRESMQVITDSIDGWTIEVTGLAAGNYVLHTKISDGCNNESYCSYAFTHQSTKKPSPVCLTRLTVPLEHADVDQDGVSDTALAVVWAEDYDQSSMPACGDDSLAFRIEWLDHLADDSHMEDADSLIVGCQDVGTHLVRVWTISYPSGTNDYCDVVLIVQGNQEFCSNVIFTQETEHRQLHDQVGKISRQPADLPDIEVIYDLPQNIDGPAFHLFQNKPNPFHDQTSIGFYLPKAAEATLTIYNPAGTIIKIVRDHYAKGYHEISVNHHEIGGGTLLFYQLETGDYLATRRMIWLR